MLQNIIKNRNNSFTWFFNRVEVVFCNERVDSLPYTLLANAELEVETYYLDDFSTTSLTNNDLVIFEDIVHITPVITEDINVLAHHLDHFVDCYNKNISWCIPEDLNDYI